MDNHFANTPHDLKTLCPDVCDEPRSFFSFGSVACKNVCTPRGNMFPIPRFF